MAALSPPPPFNATTLNFVDPETQQRLVNRGASIVGDVLLAAAFVSYAGAFSKDYRQELWQNR